MIFKAFVVPTPKRIRRYFEDTIYEMNTNTIKKEDFIIKENETNIEQSDNSIKKLGFSIKIF